MKSSGKSVDNIAINIAVITNNDGFRGMLGVMSTIQLDINSESYYFSLEVDQRRIKAANRLAYGPSQPVRGPCHISSKYILFPRILVDLFQILLSRDKFLISTVF